MRSLQKKRQKNINKNSFDDSLFVFNDSKYKFHHKYTTQPDVVACFAVLHPFCTYAFQTHETHASNTFTHDQRPRVYPKPTYTHTHFPFDFDVLCYLIVNLCISTQQLILPFMDNFHKPFRHHWQPSPHPNEKVRISNT